MEDAARLRRQTAEVEEEATQAFAPSAAPPSSRCNTVPVLLANIATAPVASAPEPFDVARRAGVPPFVAIRAAVALAFQHRNGTHPKPMPSLASEDQLGCVPRARNAGTLEPNSHMMIACYNCHNNKPYAIAHKTPRTWRRNQPPFDTHGNGTASCYSTSMTAV